MHPGRGAVALQSTLIIAGVAFVAAAIVGGGSVAFKVEIPLVDSVARQTMLGVFGMALLIAGFTIAGSDNGEAESAVALPATTTVPSTTTVVASPTTSIRSTTSAPETSIATTTSAAPEPEREWVLVIDKGGKLGVTVPSDWSVIVEDDAIWASPAVDEWYAATQGEGPANHEGYYIRRIPQPDTGTMQEIANEYLKAMGVPTQCASTLR